MVFCNPISRRSSRQGVLAYGTAESEYISANDTIILIERDQFTQFFSSIQVTFTQDNEENLVLCAGNTGAIATAGGFKPRSC